MRKLNRALLCLLTAGAMSAVNADVIIDGDTIPSAEITTITIEPMSGDIQVTTSTGYTLSGGGVTPPPPPPTGPVSILSFEASSMELELGQNVVFSWTTENAASCFARLGNAEWQSYTPSPLASGSKMIRMDTLGTTKYRLNCVGSDGVVKIRGIDITVNPSIVDNTSSCDAPRLTATGTTAWSTFWEAPFPNTATDQRLINVGRPDRFKALSFNTGNYQGSGSVITISNTITPGARRASISQCPGKFDVQPACYQEWGNGQILSWSTDGQSGACQLNPNTIYYLNLTFVADEFASPLTSFCTNSFTACYMTIKADTNTQ